MAFIVRSSYIWVLVKLIKVFFVFPYIFLLYYCIVSTIIIIVYYATDAANIHTQLHVQEHNKNNKIK